MRTIKGCSLVVLAALAFSGSVAGQSSRESIILEAREEFDDTVAVGLYQSALDPALGAPDTLWVVAGLEMADRLIMLDQGGQASLWLRWIARHGPAWSFDREWYDAVVDEYDLAVEEVEGAGDESPATTAWRWPSEVGGSGTGFVEVESAAVAESVLVAVEGEDQPQTAESLELDPGTYSLLVSAEGYEAARVVREVLPGVVTVLDVDMAPLLTSGVQNEVESSLVNVRFSLAGGEVCRNGILTGNDGLLLTTQSGLEGGVSLRAVASGREDMFLDVPVLATDPEWDLAVLKLDMDRISDLPRVGSASTGDYAWSVFSSNCAAPNAVRTRISDWPNVAGTLGHIGTPLPESAVGAPLVDHRGSLLGIVNSPTTVIPFSLAEPVLLRAQESLRAEAREAEARQAAADQAGEDIGAQLSPRGRFPWKWVGAGAVVAGVGTALLLKKDEPPRAKTGGVVVSFPVGG